MLYPYVGPADLLAAVAPGSLGFAVEAGEVLGELECAEPFTFVVDAEGILRLAPRRSEHVACAGGRSVLSAGEMSFVRDAHGRWSVSEVTNQSTGYCPDASSWPAVAAALERAGIGHPGGFTHEFVFRWCPECAELNVVRERVFVCALCDAELEP